MSASTQSKAWNEKFCTECGARIKAKAEICIHCGCRQPGLYSGNGLTVTAPNGKSQPAAALFALFLGGPGVHKFYLGRIGWGIICLLFSWTFIPAIIGFIEGIILLTISPDRFATKYGNT